MDRYDQVGRLTDRLIDRVGPSTLPGQRGMSSQVLRSGGAELLASALCAGPCPLFEEGRFKDGPWAQGVGLEAETIPFLGHPAAGVFKTRSKIE